MQFSSIFFSLKRFITDRGSQSPVSHKESRKSLRKSFQLGCTLKSRAFQKRSNLQGRFQIISTTILSLDYILIYYKKQIKLFSFILTHKNIIIALTISLKIKDRKQKHDFVMSSCGSLGEGINSTCVQQIFKMEIESKQHSYLDEYMIIKTLGAGYHAQVKLGKDDQGNLVAIKKYKKQTATLETLKHQLNIMKQLNHENLVKLISVRENAIYKKKNQVTYNCFAIVLEYVGGGELFDFVAETGKFSEKVTRTYFHQMMNGLHYMHSKGFAHRDIKPENVLLSHLYVLKIADFGFSCLLKGKDGTGVLHTKLGTEGYMAPEIPTKKYEGKSCDIFAAGVILFIMYAGNPPFEKASLNDPYYKIIKEKKYDVFWKAHSRKRTPNFFSESFKDLFIRMVSFEPAERIKIEGIASHPWIKEAICTHGEIKQEFTSRQKKLDNILQSRRLEQQKEKAAKMTAINSQGIEHRSGGSQGYGLFLQHYNKEYHLQRTLPHLEASSVYDIILKENKNFTIAQVKTFFNDFKLPLVDQEDEEDQLLGGEETDVLKLSKLEDDGANKMIASFTYSFEIDEAIFQEKLVVAIEFGQNSEGSLVVKFEGLQGNPLYFKKVLRAIKSKCFSQ